MLAQERPYEPPLRKRAVSTFVLGTVGSIARIFMHGLNKAEVHGLEEFTELLDKRRDENARERGLITVSNHLSVVDDPLLWGALPFRYHWLGASNHRWSLGSYDICFKNRFSSAFFTYGNTLPTQRSAHSTFGGLFQPTITQCIQLLSSPHEHETHDTGYQAIDNSDEHSLLSDPFSTSQLTYSTNGTDSFPAPAAYLRYRYSWIHIFPEGMIHQHPQTAMRYFKWGVARLLLEAEPCPDVVPIWIDGSQNVMNELRGWPRPVPRAGQRLGVWFGERVDGEKVFGEFRERWRRLKEKVGQQNHIQLSTDGAVSRSKPTDDETRIAATANPAKLGVIENEELRYGAEAQQLRIEVTLVVRNEVLKVRKAAGFPDEDPKRSLAETFSREGKKREGVMDDQSVVKDM